jgi:hypothetical protein
MEERIVFILGIEARSGTNYLRNLLIHHPRCRRLFSDPRAEDFLIANLGHLKGFEDDIVKRVSQWEDHRQKDGAVKVLEEAVGAMAAEVVTRLGGGTTGTSEGYLVTKSPSTEGLALFPKYLNRHKLIILVRNGVSVVESMKVGFGWDYLGQMLAWRDSARRILSFVETQPEGSFVLVRYEDLHDDPEKEMRRVLDYLALDAGDYPMARLRDEPVFGSSYMLDENGEVQWRGLARPDGFDPRERGSDWPPRRREIFRRIAGSEMERLGYPMAEPDDVRLWDIRLGLEIAAARFRMLLTLPIVALRSARLRIKGVFGGAPDDAVYRTD